MTTAVIVAAPSPCRPARRRQRLRTAILATLAVIVLSLVASAPAASASAVPAKECIEVKEDYDLRRAARENDVLVVVHEKDDQKARDDVCNKLKDTPDETFAGTGTVFAYLVVEEPSEDLDGEWKAGNKGFVKGTLGVRRFPSFLFVSKGMDRNSKFSNHINHYKGSADSLEMSDVEKFIEKKVGFRIGNDVFNIIFFDSVASSFVSYGDTAEWSLDRFKQRLLALLVRFSTLFSFKEPFSSIGKLYNRAFAMSFEHGVDYCEKQVEKLQKKLESKKASLSREKQHEFQQKISILKSFAEPKELTAEDEKQILMHGALHFGLLVATLLLFIVPDEKSEDEAKEDGALEGEEAVNAEPIVAKAVDEDEPLTEKKTE